jgi:hypothetical protein
MSSTMNTLSKYNNRLIENLENPIIKYGFLILVVIKIMAIDYIPTSYLKIYNNIFVKIIYAFVIAYCACFDPIYAIALTTLIIISLQELYSRRATISGNYVPIQGSNYVPVSNIMNNKGTSLSRIAPKPFIPSEINGNTMSKQSVRYENNSIPSNEYLANDETIFAEINKHTLQKTPSIGDEKLIAEYDYYEDPAFRTITANLKDREIFGNNDFYVMSDDLKKAQQNKVSGSKQYNSIQAFAGPINNIQGLPNGFDPTTK